MDSSNILGQNSVKVESLESPSIRITTGTGDITSKSIKGDFISLLSQTGNVNCLGLSQGRITIHSGSGVWPTIPGKIFILNLFWLGIYIKFRTFTATNSKVLLWKSPQTRGTSPQNLSIRMSRNSFRRLETLRSKICTENAAWKSPALEIWMLVKHKLLLYLNHACCLDCIIFFL